LFQKCFSHCWKYANDAILGTPFLTQIYLFYVNETGVHTKIMGKPISFNFLSEARQKEVLNLQSFSIFKQINTLRSKQRKICHLEEEISYHRIEEQLKTTSIQLKISEF